MYLANKHAGIVWIVYYYEQNRNVNPCANMLSIFYSVNVYLFIYDIQNLEGYLFAFCFYFFCIKFDCETEKKL